MINKILFTIFAVIAIWKAFQLISKLTGNSGGLPGIKQAGDRDRAPRQPEQKAEAKAVEMKPCPRCGAYIDPRERCNCT